MRENAIGRVITVCSALLGTISVFFKELNASNIALVDDTKVGTNEDKSRIWLNRPN